MEMLSIDRGAGMQVSEALEDGHSTAGSSGIGLEAIRRIALEFDVDSLRGRGTAVAARVWERSPSGLPPLSRHLTGAICLPMPGEPISGDAWLAMSFKSRSVCAVIDGIGHGSLAAEAASSRSRPYRTILTWR